MTKEQKQEMFKKLADECATKEGATAADVDEALSGKLPSTNGGKCLHACIGEALGIVSLLPINSIFIDFVFFFLDNFQFIFDF